MASNWVAFAEMALILGLAVGWGVWELLGLRRYRAKRDRENAAGSQTGLSGIDEENSGKTSGRLLDRSRRSGVKATGRGE